jgi:hypothetical protein
MDGGQGLSQNLDAAGKRNSPEKVNTHIITAAPNWRSRSPGRAAGSGGYLDYNCNLRTIAANPLLRRLPQIRPGQVVPVGFEVGSGTSMNPSLSEEDAARQHSNALN